MNNFRTLRGKAAGFTLIEIMIVVLIIGILLAIAIPNFIRARESSRAKSCQANLKQIDSAVQQAMMDGKASSITSVAQAAVGDTAFSTTAVIAASGSIAAIDLVPTYIRANPACPEGGKYTTGDGTVDPTCSLSAAAPFNSGGTYPHTLGGT